MDKNIILYIFYLGTNVSIAFLRYDEVIHRIEVPKRALGETLVESFGEAMKNLNMSLLNIDSIYFSSSPVELNAVRLVTLFVKTIISFSDIKLYVKQTSDKAENVEFIPGDFLKSREIFRHIKDPLDLVPFYNSSI